VSKSKHRDSVYAWTVLHQILQNEGINVEEHPILLSGNKPYISGNPLYFNLSHSRGVVAIITSDQECGIDIEYVDAERNYIPLAYRVFGTELMEREEFFTKWVELECKIKYRNFKDPVTLIKKLTFGNSQFLYCAKFMGEKPQIITFFDLDEERLREDKIPKFDD
jgi:hypothetical protein